MGGDAAALPRPLGGQGEGLYTPAYPPRMEARSIHGSRGRDSRTTPSALMYDDDVRGMLAGCPGRVCSC